MSISMHTRSAVARRVRRRDPSRGGAAVEFALVLPIFLLLVMGALDYGYFFFSEQVVTGAAREGARAGSTDTLASAAATAKSVAYTYMTRNGINCDTGDDTCVHTSAPTIPIDGLTINRVIVDIHYPFKSLTGYSSIIIPGQIQGYAETRW